MKTLILLVYAGFVFFMQNSWASGYSELYAPDVPKLYKISLKDEDIKIFDSEIKRIYDSKSASQGGNKNYYNANVEMINGESKISCGAKIKINGDWKDHINATLSVASLNVRLVNCHAGDIEHFKLFLPNTREFDNEIFWSVLLDYYGFPTLYTRSVLVDFNSRKYSATFQEVPSMQFLERHGIRETAIVKSDERQLWETVSKFTIAAAESPSNIRSDHFAPGGNVMKDGLIRYMGATSLYGNVVNGSFLKEPLNYNISLNALSQYLRKEELVENSRFYNLINRLYAAHGLNDHNRIFAYMPITNTFVPIYYDGNVQIDGGTTCNISTQPPAQILDKFYERAGVEMPIQMKCAYFNIDNYSQLNHWGYSDLFSRSLPVDLKYLKSENFQSGFKDIKMKYVKSIEYVPYLTDPSSGEEVKITTKKLKNVIEGKGNFDANGNRISIVNIGETAAKIKSQGHMIQKEGIYNFEVGDDTKLYLNLMGDEDKYIYININGGGGKVIVTGLINSGTKMHITGDSQDNRHGSRHDNQMLTGCITFYHSEFNGGTITSDVQGCEDSVNFLNSFGNVDSITIDNATADALDADFSNIVFRKVNINGAGNDCIDLSGGKYVVDSATLIRCSDKGVSVGEGSAFTSTSVHVVDSNYGIVSKDESTVRVIDFTGIRLRNECYSSYIKKTRFKKPSIEILNANCNN